MTDCVLYCSANGSALLILSLIDGFHDNSHTILLRGWQRIALFSTCQWRSRFRYHFAQRMVSYSLFFRSSTGITSVCTPYFSQDGSPLLILPLVKGFSDNSLPYCLDGSEFLVLQLPNSFHNGLYVLLSSGWQRIAHSFSRQYLSRQFACCLAQWMLAHCWFFRSWMVSSVNAP